MSTPAVPTATRPQSPRHLPHPEPPRHLNRTSENTLAAMVLPEYVARSLVLVLPRDLGYQIAWHTRLSWLHVGLGTPDYDGLLAPSGTPARNGSLTSCGTPSRHGLLTSFGTLACLGSLSWYGALRPDGSLPPIGTLTRDGSPGFYGTPRLRGSLSPIGTLARDGSPPFVGTLHRHGSLSPYGTPRFNGYIAMTLANPGGPRNACVPAWSGCRAWVAAPQSDPHKEHAGSG